MKKQYSLFFAFAFLMLAVTTADLKAQVTGMPAGYLTDFPVISTAQNPVWYNMMSSNYGNNIEQRRNRYMYWDGTALAADKFDAGITAEIQNDKYMWRLEQAPGTNDDTHKYVYLVSKVDNQQISFSNDAGATNPPVTMSAQGIQLKMGTSQELKDLAKFTNEIPVPGQYYMENESVSPTISLLNISGTYGLIWFNAYASTTKSSGWFFYPAVNSGVENVKNDLFNVYPNPFNNVIQIDNKVKNLEKVEIYNVQGSKVISERVNPYTLNTEALVPGLYIVKAYAGGNVYSKKLMK